MAATGITPPRPDATVTLRDLRFTGAATLPRDGTVRVRNSGWAPHHAQALRLRPGASNAAFRRALLGSSDAAFNRVVDFRNSIELSSILTRGSVTDQDVRFPRRGRYALVCFIENHQAQRMYRVVNVR